MDVQLSLGIAGRVSCELWKRTFKSLIVDLNVKRNSISEGAVVMGCQHLHVSSAMWLILVRVQPIS
jgi:hypothetical protein